MRERCAASLQVIIDTLQRAGDSAEWGGGYALPPQVLARATAALETLSDIQTRSDAASFLAGARCALGFAWLHAARMPTGKAQLLIDLRCHDVEVEKCWASMLLSPTDSQ
jgi:hypothetical protein